MSAMWASFSASCDIDIHTSHVLHDREIWNGSFLRQYHLMIFMIKVQMKYILQVAVICMYVCA